MNGFSDRGSTPLASTNAGIALKRAIPHFMRIYSLFPFSNIYKNYRKYIKNTPKKITMQHEMQHGNGKYLSINLSKKPPGKATGGIFFYFLL